MLEDTCLCWAVLPSTERQMEKNRRTFAKEHARSIAAEQTESVYKMALAC